MFLKKNPIETTKRSEIRVEQLASSPKNVEVTINNFYSNKITNNVIIDSQLGPNFQQNQDDSNKSNDSKQHHNHDVCLKRHGPCIKMNPSDLNALYKNELLEDSFEKNSWDEIGTKIDLQQNFENRKKNENSFESSAK